jgi:hypothetical protein
MSEDVTAETPVAAPVNGVTAVLAQQTQLLAERAEIIEQIEGVGSLEEALAANEEAINGLRPALTDAFASAGLGAPAPLPLAMPSVSWVRSEPTYKFSQARLDRLTYIKSVGSVGHEDAGWADIVSSTGIDGKGDATNVLRQYASAGFLHKEGRGKTAVYSVNEEHPRVIADFNRDEDA